MTNSPKPKIPRSAPRTIANLNAEARRISAVLKKEENAEKDRQAKRVTVIAKREAALKAAREEIGTMVRKKYLTNNEVAMLVAKHGNLTPKNLQAASVAFGSPAFARAARNKQNLLEKKVGEYHMMWRRWITGLTPEQRKNVSRNVYIAVTGNTGQRLMRNWMGRLNPLMFGGRALMTKPEPPENTSETRAGRNAWRKKVNAYNHQWKGVRTALMMLAEPEVNAILRRHGLPFSTTRARRNVLNTQGLEVSQQNRMLTRSVVNHRPFDKKNYPVSFKSTVERGFPVKKKKKLRLRNVS